MLQTGVEAVLYFWGLSVLVPDIAVVLFTFR
jgi:hypothetical protein